MIDRDCRIVRCITLRRNIRDLRHLRKICPAFRALEHLQTRIRHQNRTRETSEAKRAAYIDRVQTNIIE
jgi:hypothetical protein